MEEYLSQSWIKYCVTRFLLQWYIDLRFCRCALHKYSWIVFKLCLGTLCTYSLIVYSELITFPCINLTCLIYVLKSQIIIICILLLRLILYRACCYLMTSSISTRWISGIVNCCCCYYYYCHLLSQAFSSWYFSWTSGDPHRSGFKLHTAVLSVSCVMFQV
jgi:hypothetical protein